MTVLENLCIPLEYAAHARSHGADVSAEALEILDAGEKIAEGTPDEIMRNKEVERAYLGE